MNTDRGTISGKASARLHSDDRTWLRRLDGCLALLEEEHEHDELRVSPSIAPKLQGYVSGITPGMSIAGAIQLVLRQQERYLLINRRRHVDASMPDSGTAEAGSRSQPPLQEARQDREIEAPGIVSQFAQAKVTPPASTAVVSVSASSRSPEIGGAGSPRLLIPAPLLITADEARTLTERIRRAAVEACMLLLEAHERRAWSALGYGTWERYVRVEFDLSRSRSYQLLDQARVIHALQEASGMSRILDISALAAEDLKPHLLEVVEAVRLRTSELPPDRAAAVVEQIVREQRNRVSVWRKHRRSASRARSGTQAITPRISEDFRATDEPRLACSTSPASSVGQMRRLDDALEALAHMPPVEEAILELRQLHWRCSSNLAAASRWLADFTHACGCTDGSCCRGGHWCVTT